MAKIKNNQELQLTIKKLQLIEFQIEFTTRLKNIFALYIDVQDDEMVSGVDVYWILHDIIHEFMDFGDILQDYMLLCHQKLFDV